MDSQQQEAEETIPESSTSRYGRKGHESSEKNDVPWHNRGSQWGDGFYG